MKLLTKLHTLVVVAIVALPGFTLASGLSGLDASSPVSIDRCPSIKTMQSIQLDEASIEDELVSLQGHMSDSCDYWELTVGNFPMQSGWEDATALIRDKAHDPVKVGYIASPDHYGMRDYWDVCYYYGLSEEATKYISLKRYIDGNCKLQTL